MNFFTSIVTDQQGIIDMMNALLKDSLVDFPCKNDGETIEKKVPPIETVIASGDQFGAMYANNEEEQTNFLVETVESADDHKISAAVAERFHMCPEDSKSARSDLTEEEIRWLLRASNLDLNPNEVSDRTARERKWSSRLWNFDLNEGDDTIARSRSAKRDKWLSRLWGYFLNGWDKVDSGEYILSKPPKKPGRTRNLKTQKFFWNTSLYFATTLASTAWAADNTARPESTLDGDWCMSVLSSILKLVLMLGIILQMFQLAVKLWAGIELVCEFIQVVQAFMDCFEVDRTNSSTVHLVLFKCLRRDSPLTAEGNPKERVQTVFES